VTPVVDGKIVSADWLLFQPVSRDIISLDFIKLVWIYGETILILIFCFCMYE
jgi:hypothetical protein